MKSPAMSFLGFVVLTCTVLFELGVALSEEYDIDGQSGWSNVESTIKIKQPDDGSFANVNAKNLHLDTVHHHRGLLRRRIESNRIRWEPLGDLIVGEAGDDGSGYGSGMSIAMSDDGGIIAIGAAYNDGGGEGSGYVRVFRLTNDTWTQVGDDITGKEPNEYCGFSIDMSGDGTRIVIGGYKASNFSGVVRIYHHNDDYDNSIWEQVGADLRGNNDGLDRFGWSVSMSRDGTSIAVGAFGDASNGTLSGSVTVYFEESGQWQKAGDKLYGNDENDQFGRSVSLSRDGSVIAIGAPAEDSATRPGYARIYKFEKKTNGEWGWTEFGKLSGDPSGDRFGSNISLSGNGSYLGISGYNQNVVKVYKISESAGFVQVGNGITVQTDWAPISFSNDGKMLIVGEKHKHNDDFGKDANRARVFRLGGGGVWEQIGDDLFSLDDTNAFATLVSEDRHFGHGVAISRDGLTVAAASHLSDLKGNINSGHARVFRMSQYRQPAKPPTQSSTQPANIDLIIGLCSVAGITLLIAVFVICRRCKKDTISPNTPLPNEKDMFREGFFLDPDQDWSSSPECDIDHANTMDTDLDEEEEINRDIDAISIALSKEFQKVTQHECRRFLNKRSINTAKEKLSKYIKWRVKYHLDENCGETNDIKHSDASLWEHAIRKSQRSFSHIFGEEQNTESDSSAKVHNNTTDTVTNFTDLTKRLPRFIRMVNSADDHNNVASSTDQIESRGGRRVLYILMNLIDSRIAPLQFYALVLAIYLDLHLDRNSMEDIVTLIDVRKGKGWCNAPSLSILPFLKETVKHMEHFPDRMHRCIVFPVPHPAKFIWNLVKGFLKDSMANRVRIHWGSYSIESEMPESLGDFFHPNDLDHFECMRVSEFCG